MKPTSLRYLYGFAIAYAVISFIIRENGFIIITVIGFGLPVIAFLLLEWVVPPLLAAYFGFQARWSFSKAFNGAPLVFLYTVVECGQPI